MFPESSSTPTPRTSPIVGTGSSRVSRTADVVLARLIADEASFARRVHRTRESPVGHRGASAQPSFLGKADADAEHLV